MAAKREISSTLRNLKVRSPLSGARFVIPSRWLGVSLGWLCLCGVGVQFMQRGAAAQKVEEKAKVEVQEEVAAAAPSGGFGSSAQVARKWYGDWKLRFLIILVVVVF